MRPILRDIECLFIRQNVLDGLTACLFCTRPFLPAMEVFVLPCRHFFHVTCVQLHYQIGRDNRQQPHCPCCHMASPPTEQCMIRTIWPELATDDFGDRVRAEEPLLADLPPCDYCKETLTSWNDGEHWVTVYRVLSCGHSFHPACFLGHVSGTGHCFNCESEVATEDVHYCIQRTLKYRFASAQGGAGGAQGGAGGAQGGEADG